MNDNPPIFERHTYRAELFENNYVGVHIVQVTATDMDSKNNSQPEYWLEDPTKSFQIQSNGLITASAALDRERHREHHFTVFAKDQGHPPLTSSSQISVKVLDVNDELPKFPRNQFRFEVLENQPIEVEVGTLEASDLDGPTFNEFKFSFFHHDDLASENFKLDPTNGRISTLKSFDREEQKSYRFLVSVVDIQNNILFSTATVSVKIGDLNDQTPTFTFPTSDNHTIRLPTRAKKNHPVTKISAFDFDEGPNGTIVYEIVKGNELEIFSLESTTGNLFVSQDRSDDSPLSNHSSFSLVLCARDGGPKSLKNFTFLNILLVDQWFTMGGGDDNDDTGLDYDGWFINFASHQSKRVAVWMVTGVSVVVVLFLLITIATVLWKQRSNGKSFKQHKKKLNSPKENGSINKFNNDINNADINTASKNAALYKQQQINKMFANNDSNTSGQKILNNSNYKIVSSTPEIIKKIDLTNITESIIPTNPVNHAAVDTTKIRSDSFDSLESPMRSIARSRDQQVSQYQSRYEDFNPYDSRCNDDVMHHHHHHHSPPPPPPPLDRDEVFQAANDHHHHRHHNNHHHHHHHIQSSMTNRFQSLPRPPNNSGSSATHLQHPLMHTLTNSIFQSPSTMVMTSSSSSAICASPGIMQRNLNTAIFGPPPANISRFAPCTLDGDTIIFDGEVTRLSYGQNGSGFSLLNHHPMR